MEVKTPDEIMKSCIFITESNFVLFSPHSIFVKVGEKMFYVEVGYIWHANRPGEMPERSNGTVSKTVVRATVPRVRIPLSPPPLAKAPTGNFT